MVLIDTSCWIQALRRKGDEKVKRRVAELMDAKMAAWCDPVQLELWNGASNERERQFLDSLDRVTTKLEIDEHVWSRAKFIASKARSRGVNVPAIDVLIFACADVHGVRLERADKHFDLLEDVTGMKLIESD